MWPYWGRVPASCVASLVEWIGRLRRGTESVSGRLNSANFTVNWLNTINAKPKIDF